MKTFKEILSEAKQRLKRLDQSFGNMAKKLADTENPTEEDLEKLGKLTDDRDVAYAKDERRVIGVADSLLKRNPQRYLELKTQVKPQILDKHSNKIERISARLEKVRSLNAPDEVIKMHQDALDTASDSFNRDVHRAVGEAHRTSMETLYKPQGQ